MSLLPFRIYADGPERFPLRLGYDCAGVVTEIGDKVTKLKVGDEVYTRLPHISRGMALEIPQLMKGLANLAQEHGASMPSVQNIMSLSNQSLSLSETQHHYR